MIPLVSVIIPVYNAERYIAETVRSVLDQDYRRFEVIVVDDGSTDNGIAGIADYEHVRVVRQDNRGPSAARNNGIKMAKGTYCAFLDSDDAMLPGRLRSQVERIDANDDIGLVYTDLMTFDKGGIVHRSKKEFTRLYGGAVLDKLLRYNFITTSTVMARKSCFDRVGYFDESLTRSEDYKMWLNIAKSYRIEYVDMPLVKYRYHEESLSYDKVRIGISSYDVVSQFWKENEEYRRRHRTAYRISMANQLKQLGFAHLNQCNHRQALLFLGQSLRFYPFSLDTQKAALKALGRLKGIARTTGDIGGWEGAVRDSHFDGSDKNAREE